MSRPADNSTVSDPPVHIDQAPIGTVDERLAAFYGPLDGRQWVKFAGMSYSMARSWF